MYYANVVERQIQFPDASRQAARDAGQAARSHLENAQSRACDVLEQVRISNLSAAADFGEGNVQCCSSFGKGWDVG
jgi:hypothetical protein